MINNKKKILFVCMGNICRSPAAEAVMKFLVEKNDFANKIEIDSAGTIDYHTGEEADPRMKKHALSRGYKLTSIAKQFNPDKDFEKFDYIITMDDENYYRIKELDFEDKFDDKIFKMVDFSNEIKVDEVPDPYFGGDAGFEHVLDILEDATQELFKKVKEDIER